MNEKESASITINLLPKDPFFETTVGKTLRWALSAGRYIVIFTELVVILSFLARFTLDRQLTDINSAIAENETVIETYGNLENDFRGAQEKIDHIEQINNEANLVDAFAFISEVTPRGINVTELRILPDEISLSGTTTSQNNLNLLINNLQLSEHFSDVRVNQISNQEEGRPGYQFQLDAQTQTAVTVREANSSTNAN